MAGLKDLSYMRSAWFILRLPTGLYASFVKLICALIKRGQVSLSERLRVAVALWASEQE